MNFANVSVFHLLHMKFVEMLKVLKQNYTSFQSCLEFHARQYFRFRGIR